MFGDARVAKIWIATLKSNPAVTEKIFWLDVPQSETMPYITIAYMEGGDENRAQSQAYSACWRILGYSKSSQEAVALGTKIHDTLHRAMPTIPLDVPLKAYHWIIRELSIVERFQVQNVPVFMCGGEYRISLCE